MIKIELKKAKGIINEFLNKEVHELQSIIGADHPYYIGFEELTVADVVKAYYKLVEAEVFR